VVLATKASVNRSYFNHCSWVSAESWGIISLIPQFNAMALSAKSDIPRPSEDFAIFAEVNDKGLKSI